MSLITSIVIITAVLIAVGYLIYSNNTNQRQSLGHPSLYLPARQQRPPCNYDYSAVTGDNLVSVKPPNTVIIEKDGSQYNDTIKQQDLNSMMDPLAYPQLRLPREVLQKYEDYQARTGVYPPFNLATNGNPFDNPVLTGVLIKVADENEPFADNIPSAVPLFKIKSAKNNNRFFYYVIDQRYLSKIEIKVPLDHIRVNGSQYKNTDFYGIPELYDGDIIEHIPIFMNTKFKVMLYKTYHFP